MPLPARHSLRPRVLQPYVVGEAIACAVKEFVKQYPSGWFVQNRYTADIPVCAMTPWKKMDLIPTRMWI